MVTGNAAPFPLHGLQQISFLPVSSCPVNTPLHGGEGRAALYGSANQYFSSATLCLFLFRFKKGKKKPREKLQKNKACCFGLQFSTEILA